MDALVSADEKTTCFSCGVVVGGDVLSLGTAQADL